MPSTTQTQTPPNNPHFNHIERAPYELGHLLQQLPADFSSLSAVEPDVLLIAEAAISHATNANSTVMHGIEALGQMLFLAGTNTDFDLERSSISDLGCLLKHLAVEAQFLQETESNLSYAVSEHRKRPTPPKRGANHA
jgi:hypothetical protein